MDDARFPDISFAWIMEELNKLFSSFSLESKKEELYHTYSGRISNIKTFTTSPITRVYFELKPRRCFWLYNQLPTEIKIGSDVIIHYKESIVNTYTKFWIEYIKLVEEPIQTLEPTIATKRHSPSSSPSPLTIQKLPLVHQKNPKDKPNNLLSAYCLNCKQELPLVDFRRCRGTLRRSMFIYVQCDICNNEGDGNIGSQCEREMYTCTSCKTVRVI